MGGIHPQRKMLEKKSKEKSEAINLYKPDHFARSSSILLKVSEAGSNEIFSST